MLVQQPPSPPPTLRSPEMSRRRAEPAQSSTHNYTKQEKSEDESNTDLEPTNPHTDVSITNVRHPSFTIHAEVCLWNRCQRLPDEKRNPSWMTLMRALITKLWARDRHLTWTSWMSPTRR
ncbi:uncharacterized protein LOC143962481 isoform X3 [Lithobates pipiens]